MKSNFKLFLPLAGLGALVWAGCQTQFPPSYPHLTTTGGSVINFESPWNSPQGTIPTAQPAAGPITDTTGMAVSQLTISANLVEANKPNNLIVRPGTIVATGSPSVNPVFVGPGANGTNYCVHLFTTFQGAGGFPAVLLTIPLESSGNAYFDASFFTGVKFYYKVPGDDSVSTRSFQIPISSTASTSSGGTCDPTSPNTSGGACFANFSFTYTPTNGAWQPAVLPFSSFTRQSYGVAISPTTLSGTNLQKILGLVWSEGNNNAAGLVTSDFYVDEVQFY